MKFILIIRSVSTFYCTSVRQQSSKEFVELTAKNLTSNFQVWEHDVAVMYYAPWCKYCKQLAPYMEHIAEELKENKDIIIGKFNCEEPSSHVEICKDLKVTHYPSIQFIGYGNFNQGPDGKILGQTEYPRIVRFSSDLLLDAIFDWINMLSSISWFHRKWDDFWGLFFPVKFSRLSKKVKVLGNEILLLRSEVINYKKKINIYRANEIFDSLTDQGDPFPLLQDEPDKRNLPLRICVGDMAEEYCKYHRDEEPYCKIMQQFKCVGLEMKPDECRPKISPFINARGRKVVSICLDKNVFKMYTTTSVDTTSESSTGQSNSSSGGRQSNNKNDLL